MKVVISLGGSVIVPNELDVKFIKEFAKIIKKYKRRHTFQIVCGGGKTARIYTKKMKELGLKEKDIHEIAIATTHVNAKLIAKMINGKFSAKHPEKIGKMKGLIVSGGYKPGWTTDVDAALIAKSMHADFLINITDVKGVYTADPHKNKNAVFLPELTWEAFFKIMKIKEIKPGGHFVFDPLASKICKKNKIKVIVIGKNLKNFEKVLKNEKFTGTIIR